MESNEQLEVLVQKVTEQVLQHLRSKGENASSERLVVLIPQFTTALPALVNSLEALLKKKKQIHVLASKAVISEVEQAGFWTQLGPKVQSMEEACLGTLLANLSSRDALLLGSLGFAWARRLWNLEDDDPFVRLVCQALLRRIRVLALRDDLWVNPKNSGATELERKAGEACQNLTRLGVKLMPVEDLSRELEYVQAKRSTLLRSIGELLTEADVDQLLAQGESRVVLPASSIVTPLAQSRAREFGLELLKQE